MAYTSVNPVSVGDETKKSHYDTVFDNTAWLRDSVLGVGAGSIGEHIGATNAPIFDDFKLNNTIGLALADTDLNGFRAATTSVNSAGWLAYSKNNLSAPGRLVLVSGAEGMTTGGTYMHVVMQEASGAGILTNMAKFDTSGWTNYTGFINRDIKSTLALVAGPTGLSTDSGINLTQTDHEHRVPSGGRMIVTTLAGTTRAAFYDTGQFSFVNTAGNTYFLSTPGSYQVLGRDSAGTTRYVFDATNKLIKVGATSGDYIEIDGAGTGGFYKYNIVTSAGTTTFANKVSGGSPAAGCYIAPAGGGAMDFALAKWVRVGQSTSSAGATFGEIRWNTSAAAGQKLQCYDGTSWKYITLT